MWIATKDKPSGNIILKACSFEFLFQTFYPRSVGFTIFVLSQPSILAEMHDGYQSRLQPALFSKAQAYLCTQRFASYVWGFLAAKLVVG